MISKDTKIIEKAYCRRNMGYGMVCLEVYTTADINAQGKVGMIVRNQPQVWSIKETRFQGKNVMSCEVDNGKRTPID